VETLGGGKHLQYPLAFDLKNKESKGTMQFNNQTLKMSAKNDACKFVPPRNAQDVDSQIFDYYSKNTYLRQVDVDQDPGDQQPQ